MYVKLGMFFKSEIDAPDFGSISMYFVGPKEQGYVEDGNKKIRKYTLLSTDLNKLNNITNALDGSEALTVDTGNSYILSNNTWSLKSAGLTPTDVAEILGNITQIDYQVVNQLPQTGIKGTIYLVSHETAQGDYYDEYIWTTKVDSSTGENINIYEKIGNTAPTISTMVGATYYTNGSSGLVPAPSEGDVSKVLFGDGQWKKIQYYPYKQLSSSSVNCNDYISTGLYFISYASQLQNGPENFSLSSNSGAYLKIRRFNSYRSETGIQELIGEYQRYERSFSYNYSTDSYLFSSWIQKKGYIPIVENETGEIPKFKSDGTLESSGFTIESSVPANAVFTDTTYNAATQNTNGLMTAADKTKLDGININNYSMKSDAVVCTEDEYNSLATKTAEFYYIIQED